MTLPESRTDVAKILGRDERPLHLSEPLGMLAGESVLVTGAAGSLGSALIPLLRDHGIPTRGTDLTGTGLAVADVRDKSALHRAVESVEPDVIFHLAGAKHAPAGEEDPFEATQVNVIGTRNLLACAPNARIVTASTCKAANPETAYGATKLLAERLTLNSGNSVARFYNVAETQGNVFEIWSALHDDEPLPVTPCRRHFISLREAVGLLLWAAVLPPARYSADPGPSRLMYEVATSLYPGRSLYPIPPRRGDRVEEPRCGSHEEIIRTEIPWIVEIQSPHDPAYEGEAPGV